jgi:hypothetical protein
MSETERVANVKKLEIKEKNKKLKRCRSIARNCAGNPKQSTDYKSIWSGDFENHSPYLTDQKETEKIGFEFSEKWRFFVCGIPLLMPLLRKPNFRGSLFCSGTRPVC